MREKRGRKRERERQTDRREKKERRGGMMPNDTGHDYGHVSCGT